MLPWLLNIYTLPSFCHSKALPAPSNGSSATPVTPSTSTSLKVTISRGTLLARWAAATYRVPAGGGAARHSRGSSPRGREGHMCSRNGGRTRFQKRSNHPAGTVPRANDHSMLPHHLHDLRSNSLSTHLNDMAITFVTSQSKKEKCAAGMRAAIFCSRIARAPIVLCDFNHYSRDYGCVWYNL
jgi:hypothetical protein